MPKKIIVLDKQETPRPTFKVAFWPDVPASRQLFYANPANVSQFKDASGAELAALQSGAVVERVETISFEPGVTVAQIKTQLVERFNVLQAQITGKNDWQYYGTNWDGTSWTNAGAT